MPRFKVDKRSTEVIMTESGRNETEYREPPWALYAVTEKVFIQ